MSWLDVREYYMDQEEPDEPVQVRNCPRCGRFLTKEPNGTYQGGESNGHFEYKPDGDDYQQIWVEDKPPTLYPLEPAWICTCGRVLTGVDIFR